MKPRVNSINTKIYTYAKQAPKILDYLNDRSIEAISTNPPEFRCTIAASVACTRLTQGSPDRASGDRSEPDDNIVFEGEGSTARDRSVHSTPADRSYDRGASNQLIEVDSGTSAEKSSHHDSDSVALADRVASGQAASSSESTEDEVPIAEALKRMDKKRSLALFSSTATRPSKKPRQRLRSSSLL